MLDHNHINLTYCKEQNYGNEDSAMKKDLLFCNHRLDFEDFSILTTNNNNIQVTITGSLLINRDQSHLNKDKQFLPVELFDN